MQKTYQRYNSGRYLAVLFQEIRNSDEEELKVTPHTHVRTGFELLR